MSIGSLIEQPRYPIRLYCVPDNLAAVDPAIQLLRARGHSVIVVSDLEVVSKRTGAQNLSPEDKQQTHVICATDELKPSVVLRLKHSLHIGGVKKSDIIVLRVNWQEPLTVLNAVQRHQSRKPKIPKDPPAAAEKGPAKPLARMSSASAKRADKPNVPRVVSRQSEASTTDSSSPVATSSRNARHAKTLIHGAPALPQKKAPGARPIASPAGATARGKGQAMGRPSAVEVSRMQTSRVAAPPQPPRVLDNEKLSPSVELPVPEEIPSPLVAPARASVSPVPEETVSPPLASTLASPQSVVSPRTSLQPQRNNVRTDSPLVEPHVSPFNEQPSLDSASVRWNGPAVLQSGKRLVMRGLQRFSQQGQGVRYATIAALVLIVGAVGIVTFRGSPPADSTAPRPTEPIPQVVSPSTNAEEERQQRQPSGAFSAAPGNNIDAAAADPVARTESKPEDVGIAHNNTTRAPEVSGSLLDTIYSALSSREIRSLDVLLVAPEATRGKRRRGKTLTFANAHDYCEELVISGLERWRVPQIGELAGLAAGGMLNKARYWSSTKGDTFGDRQAVWNGARRKIEVLKGRQRKARIVCVRKFVR